VGGVKLFGCLVEACRCALIVVAREHRKRGRALRAKRRGVNEAIFGSGRKCKEFTSVQEQKW
jgi:hypothetical protein